MAEEPVACTPVSLTPTAEQKLAGITAERDSLERLLGYAEEEKNALLARIREIEQPAHVLAETERLLREALPMMPSAEIAISVSLWGDGGATLHAPLPSRGYWFCGSLVEAYAKLVGGRDG